MAKQSTPDEFWEVKNNAVGRLYDLLDEARRQGPNQSGRAAWAALFRITPEDSGGLLRMLANVSDLVKEAKAAIQSLEDVDLALHMRPFHKVDLFVSQLNLDAKWEAWTRHIDDATLLGLQFGADKLARSSKALHNNGDEIAALRATVDQLFAEISDSSLPKELKMLLLRNLEGIRQAFVAYRVRGIDGVQAALEQSIGSMLLQPSAVESLKRDHKSISDAFFQVLQRLNTVVTLVKNVKELAAPTLDTLTRVLN